jgi:hypothetical protein
MKQGNDIPTLLFNFALEYAIKKMRENQVVLTLNRTHQLLAYADDVNLLRDNVDPMKKNTETLIDASKEVGLEINVKRAKYMLLPRHHNAGEILDTKVANRLFENTSLLKYLEMLVTNQNFI